MGTVGPAAARDVGIGDSSFGVILLEAARRGARVVGYELDASLSAKVSSAPLSSDLGKNKPVKAK